jgi:hypothetical protein
VNKQDEYRANAAECQRMAATARSEQDKLTWLEMAESWLQMLKKAEQPKTQQFDG